jgi:hypothetical protein
LIAATTADQSQIMQPMREIGGAGAAKGSGGRWDFLWPLDAIKLNIMSNVLRGGNGL